jgi:hypothetical protein
MSTQQRQPPVALNVHGGEVAPGELSGWAMFAGTMIGITAILNVVYGISAIGNANFFVHDARYVLSGLNSWGWILLIMGVIQLCAAVAIFGGTSWGRWVGVATAALNAIGQMLYLPSAPALALSVFAIDVLILYGLLAGWDERRAQ